MLQMRGYSDLLQESFCTEHGSQLGVEDLYRDFAVVLLVVGEVDDGHAACAKFSLDGVSGERTLNLLEALSHYRFASFSIFLTAVNQFTITTSLASPPVGWAKTIRWPSGDKS
jgi:hypothetical protein